MFFLDQRMVLTKYLLQQLIIEFSRDIVLIYPILEKKQLNMTNKVDDQQ
jgi:hypothetical protein